MDLPPTITLLCDPRHRMCIWCADNVRMTHCPMCRLPIAHMSNQKQDDTTSADVYIPLRDARLYYFRHYKDMPWLNNVDYNKCTHRHTIREPTELVWEVLIQSYTSGYKEALGQPYTIVDTTSARHTGTAFLPWLDTLLASEDGDLLVAYDISDERVQAPTPPTLGRQPCGTLRVPYPQPDQWIPHPTKDGDVEPNPGCTPATKGGDSLVRILTETSKKHTSQNRERAPHPTPCPNTESHAASTPGQDLSTKTPPFAPSTP